MNILKPNGKVHPVAAMFPMMSDAELDELAKDIKTSGMIHPVVLDSDGTLIDGRNRQEACKRAGVECKYVELNGVNLVVYIYKANNKRRHMKQGARAMQAAKTRHDQGWDQKVSDPENFISLPNMAALAGVSLHLLGEATVVAEHAPDEVDSVIDGATPLESAYKEAKSRKDAASSKEKQIERLREEAPDLADLVIEERLGIPGALADLKERKDKARRERQQSTEFLRDVVQILDNRATDLKIYAKGYVENFDPEFTTEEISKERLKKCVLVLSEITKQWKDESYVIPARN